MPSLDSIPDKILSAGMVIVHFDGKRYRFLAMRTFSNWDFPNTLVPDGEDPQLVATRAALESTDLSDLESPWGDTFRETLAFDDGSVTRYYIAQAKSAEVALRIPPGDGGEEDFEYRWVTAEEAEEILPPRLGMILDWAVQQLATGAR
jgi:8-oxo-dGTP pyrophosphatase MutT (NUDIX family)